MLLCRVADPAGVIDVIDGNEGVSAESSMRSGRIRMSPDLTSIGVFKRRLFGWGCLMSASRACPDSARMGALRSLFWLSLVTWSTDLRYLPGRDGGPSGPADSRTRPGRARRRDGRAAVVGALAAYAFGLGPGRLLAGERSGLLASSGSYESTSNGVRRQGKRQLLPACGVLDRLDGLLPVVLATLGLLLV